MHLNNLQLCWPAHVQGCWELTHLSFHDVDGRLGLFVRVHADYTILDAPLTKLGREQAEKLNKDTLDTVQKDVELVVSSPLR